MAVLQLEEIAVRFGSFDAVGGVSLSVHAGEIVGLIGPNGAGKTVTFNVVTGLQKPTGGRIRLHGQDVTAAPPHERTALGMGRTFQVVQLFSGLSVIENLMVAAHKHTRGGVITDALRLPGRKKALVEARERSFAVLDFLGLADLAETPADSLSVGSARLVELGRALSACSPTCCCWTSRLPASTPPRRTRSSSCWHVSGPRWAPRCCSWSTTWASSCRSATTSW